MADVVVLYNSKERQEVEPLIRACESQGISIWWDQALSLGDQFVFALQDALKSASTALYCVGKSGPGEWQHTVELGAVLESVVHGRLQLVPTLLPTATTQPDFPVVLQQFTWLDLRTTPIDGAVERIRLTIPRFQHTAASTGPSLADVIRSAQRWLVISGQTLDKFTSELAIWAALCDVLGRGVRVTILQLNPYSAHAVAHEHFHQLESSSPSHDQYVHSLAFFRDIHKVLSGAARDRLEVLFTNYMPRSRVVIADDKAYVYLYMYGIDVPSAPDLILDSPHDERGRRLVQSTMKLVDAPETLAYIRCGQLFERWRDAALSQWGGWSTDRRARHRITHDFYVTFANEFDSRLGGARPLEPYVELFLRHARGRTLVVGCGSGKEVEFIAKSLPPEQICGIDFSHVAVGTAKKRYRHLADCFSLWDIYDLPLLGAATYDTVVANASFVHLYEREDMNDVLGKVFDLLRPGGQLFVRCLFKEHAATQQELDRVQAATEGWGNPRWFVYYSPDDLVARAERVGFTHDRQLTDDIARLVYPSSGADVAKVHTHGFRHARYDVYWPTMWLRKPHLAVTGEPR